MTKPWPQPRCVLLLLDYDEVQVSFKKDNSKRRWVRGCLACTPSDKTDTISDCDYEGIMSARVSTSCDAVLHTFRHILLAVREVASCAIFGTVSATDRDRVFVDTCDSLVKDQDLHCNAGRFQGPGKVTALSCISFFTHSGEQSAECRKNITGCRHAAASRGIGAGERVPRCCIKGERREKTQKLALRLRRPTGDGWRRRCASRAVGRRRSVAAV